MAASVKEVRLHFALIVSKIVDIQCEDTSPNGVQKVINLTTNTTHILNLAVFSKLHWEIS